MRHGQDGTHAPRSRKRDSPGPAPAGATPAALDRQEAGGCDFDGWCDTTDFICRPWNAVGQACDGNTCGYEAYCNEGTCAALSAEGQPCGPGCAVGLDCGEDGMCVRRRAVACDFQQSLP